MDVGKRIQVIRESLGISQSELAGRISVDKSTMNRIESGERGVKSHELSKIADILGVSTDYLLGRKQSDNIIEITTREDAIAQLKRINKILLEEGAITEEEYKYGIKDKEKEKRLMEIVKRAIKFSIEMKNLD